MDVGREVEGEGEREDDGEWRWRESDKLELPSLETMHVEFGRSTWDI